MLDGRRPRGRATGPPELQSVSTPLVLKEWERYLKGHPDGWYRSYILRGLREGFRIGFRHGAARCSKGKAGANLVSALKNPEVIDLHLQREVEAGRVLGPLEPSSFPAAHVSRMGAIPKSEAGKWRVIVDLSHPRGGSVNDGIEPELCSLKYTSVDAAVRKLRGRPRGASLAKFDMANAYRNLPVHPDDRPLLGMHWKGNLYIDMALPFGLRSAPKIFTALADALLWILETYGVDGIHYLDDFLIFADSEEECEEALQLALRVFARLGVAVAVHKTDGPSYRITFLGIELDTVKEELRLPEEKLKKLQAAIRRWGNRRACSKRELLSLIGQLQHACCVVRPGRTFLRRMIGVAKVAKEPHHWVRLNKGFRSDLLWWARFLPTWNGTGMMSGVLREPERAVAVMTSDASGTWGCGAFISSGEWFQLAWPESWGRVHITVKELLPIIVGAAMWGHKWRGGTVRCRCDNAATVAIVNSGRSKVERVMHLMRSLFFIAAHHNIVLVAEHLPGVRNGAADALSRDDSRSFLLQVPSAKRVPDRVSERLWQALVLEQPDWTSVSWTDLLASSLLRV